MNNIYESPKSEVTVKLPKGPRPIGIVVISGLFLLFFAATSILAFMEEDGEWEIVTLCSIFLVFFLRGIYFGVEKSRSTGVFLGFFIAALNFFGFYEKSAEFESIQSVLYIAEGSLAVFSAIYLINLKGSQFFNE